MQMTLQVPLFIAVSEFLKKPTDKYTQRMMAFVLLKQLGIIRKDSNQYDIAAYRKKHLIGKLNQVSTNRAVWENLPYGNAELACWNFLMDLEEFLYAECEFYSLENEIINENLDLFYINGMYLGDRFLETELEYYQWNNRFTNFWNDNKKLINKWVDYKISHVKHPSPKDIEKLFPLLVKEFTQWIPERVHLAVGDIYENYMKSKNLEKLPRQLTSEEWINFTDQFARVMESLNPEERREFINSLPLD